MRYKWLRGYNHTTFDVALAFGVTLFLLALAWQVSTPIVINVGSQTELYLSYYYPPENSPDRDYRWVRGTDDSRMTFPGIGWGDWKMTLVAAAGSRPDKLVPLKIRAHGTVVFEEPAADPNFHSYTFTIPADSLSMGDLVLNFDMPEFSTPTDGRKLGLAVDRIELTPLLPIIPPPLAWLALSGAITLLFAALRLYSRTVAISCSGVAVLLIAYLIGAERLAITPYAMTLLVCAALFCTLTYLLHGVLRLGRVKSPEQDGELVHGNRGRLALFLLPLFAGASIFFGTQIGALVRMPFPYDFVLYYRAGENLLAGQPLYDMSLLHQSPAAIYDIYKYPPLFAFLMEPLSALSVFTAFEFWLTVNLGSLVVTLFALLRAHGRKLSHLGSFVATPAIILFVSVVILFQPAIDTLVYGQIDIAILALISLTYWALRSGKPGWAGLALAIAVLFKIYPVVLVPYLALKKEWRALASLILSLLAITLAVMLFTGIEPWRIYATEILPRSGGSTAWIENQTFAGFLGRLFTDSSRLVDFPADPALQASIVRVGTYVWAALLVGVDCWLTRRPAARRSAEYALGFALFTVTSVLVLPVAWYHYATLMLLPIGIIFFEIEEQIATRKAMARMSLTLMMILFALSVIWLAYGSYNLVWQGTNMGGWWTLLLSYKFYAMVALWVSCVLLLKALRQPRNIKIDVIVTVAIPQLP